MDRIAAMILLLGAFVVSDNSDTLLPSSSVKSIVANNYLFQTTDDSLCFFIHCIPILLHQSIVHDTVPLGTL